MKKAVCSLLVLIIALSAAMALVAGCESSGTTTKKETVAKDPTKDNPMRIDTKKKAVSIYTVVSGKYFSEPTRHGIVFTGGSNGDKSVMRTFIEPEKFYNALVKIGAKPGNNVKLDSPSGTAVQGTALKVTVKADGNSYDISDVIKSDPDKGLDIRFGGNLDNAKAKKTGCILCLDSCAVGITSSASWPWLSFKENKVKFLGREDKLPKDNESVVVTFSIK